MHSIVQPKLKGGISSQLVPSKNVVFLERKFPLCVFLDCVSHTVWTGRTFAASNNPCHSTASSHRLRTGLRHTHCEKMWIYTLTVTTFHSSILVLLPVNLTYSELMTHLPLASLGHGGRDHHKSPQHIKPGGMENRGWKRWQIYSILNTGRLNKVFCKEHNCSMT